MADYWSHQSAIIDQGSQIGKGCRIWHYSHICSGAKIGNNTSLGQNVFIASKAVIGNNCKIQNNISIYDEVVLEDDVFCGPSVVFTNVYNPRSFIERKQEYQQTLIQKGASLGANCTIICGVCVGKYAFVGAGSVVHKNVKNYALVVGNPIRQIGWMSQYGEKLDLPLQGVAEAVCQHTKQKYRLKNNQLELVES